MTESSEVRNRRIAKNTILLYIRTLVMMVISLFTSRLTLEALGVDNFGIYNVVGGFVGMFSIISGTITASVSRYLTHGLGKGNMKELTVIFSVSLTVLFIIASIVLILGESFGIWFVFNKLNIPSDRIYAAHWVLQCSLLSFVINLISVPYNASIISHERMGVFAYMTILDVMIKLLFVYSLFITPFDRLITYAVALCMVGIIMRVIYGYYCTCHFEECRYRFILNKPLIKEMTNFAGWNFLGNTAYIFNTQGVNMTINMFFGVTLNAARGVVAQVEGAVMTFVNNFTVAFTPQITKSYAEGNKSYMFSIVCRGTKFSIFLLLYILLPLSLEADYVLNLWLKDVPPMAPQFLQLQLICSAVMLMGNGSFTAIMATGNIRNYQIAVTIVGCLVFPLTWICYKMGAAAQITYYIFIIIYSVLIYVRIIFMNKLLGFSKREFIIKAILPILTVSLISFIPLYAVSCFMNKGIFRLIVITLLSLVTTTCTILGVGLTSGERTKVLVKFRTLTQRITNKC